MPAEKTNKILRILSLGIKALLALAFLGAVVQLQWIVVFVSGLTLLVVWLMPRFLVRKYRIDLPLEFEFTITLFLYASLILGELGGYYARFWWWDVSLHGIAGFSFGVIGLLLLYTLHMGGRIDARVGVIAFFAFSFAMSLGALWEIFEFTGDALLGTNMQKNGLTDTMWDLIVNAIGAFVVSLAGYYYIKKGKVGIVRRIIRSFVEKNPRFFA